MSEASSTTAITTTTVSPPPTHYILKLRSAKKKVIWTEETVDNEHLGKKSSKSIFSILLLIISLFASTINGLVVIFLSFRVLYLPQIQTFCRE
jgi:hypothetical protein